jgi:hypothetical protein
VVNVRRLASARRSDFLNGETGSARFRARDQESYDLKEGARGIAAETIAATPFTIDLLSSPSQRHIAGPLVVFYGS